VLGIVTLVWLLAVGATSVINTWADLLLDYWQRTEMAEMVAPYKGLPAPATSTLGSMQQAMSNAHAAMPGMQIAFIAFPGTPFASSHHYGIFLRGDTALRSRLYQPVRVDAHTLAVTDRRALSWYPKALLVSQPLHFGDYGGAPMKLLWALLDIATIFVLGSGVYLWCKRGAPGRAPASASASAAASVSTPASTGLR
jgi:uncharacterized iron-regulated membrane protein